MSDSPELLPAPPAATPPAHRSYGRLPALSTQMVRIQGEGPRLLAELVATLAGCVALIPLAAVLGGRAEPGNVIPLALLAGLVLLALRIRRGARSLLVIDNPTRTIRREFTILGKSASIQLARFEDLVRVELQATPRSAAGEIAWDARVVLVTRSDSEITVVPATRHQADATADAQALAEHFRLPLLTDDERRDEQEAIDREESGDYAEDRLPEAEESASEEPDPSHRTTGSRSPEW